MKCCFLTSEADPGEGLRGLQPPPPPLRIFFVILLDSSSNNNRIKLFLRRGEGYGSGLLKRSRQRQGPSLAFHTIGVQGYFGSVQPPLSEIPGSAPGHTCVILHMLYIYM